MLTSDKPSILDRFRKKVDPKELVRKWQVRGAANGDGRSLVSCTGVHCLTAYPSARAERCASCQADLRKEERSLERTIRDLQRDSKNAAKQVAVAAKRGDMASARTLAKEIVHTKKVSAGARVCLLPATPRHCRDALTSALAVCRP
jgi:hypothetical protein